VQKVIPLFCEPGKVGKNALGWPQNSPQTAKAAEVDMFVFLPTIAVLKAFKGLIESSGSMGKGKSVAT
jgi:hypothetical protein